MKVIDIKDQKGQRESVKTSGLVVHYEVGSSLYQAKLEGDLEYEYVLSDLGGGSKPRPELLILKAGTDTEVARFDLNIVRLILTAAG